MHYIALILFDEALVNRADAMAGVQRRSPDWL
jgi:hypothetical protein